MQRVEELALPIWSKSGVSNLPHAPDQIQTSRLLEAEPRACGSSSGGSPDSGIGHVAATAAAAPAACPTPEPGGAAIVSELKLPPPLCTLCHSDSSSSGKGQRQLCLQQGSGRATLAMSSWRVTEAASAFLLQIYPSATQVYRSLNSAADHSSPAPLPISSCPSIAQGARQSSSMSQMWPVNQMLETSGLKLCSS